MVFLFFGAVMSKEPLRVLSTVKKKVNHVDKEISMEIQLWRDRGPKSKLHQITHISDPTEVRRLVGQQLSGIVHYAITTHYF